MSHLKIANAKEEKIVNIFCKWERKNIQIYIYIYIYIQTLQHIASFYCKFILKIYTAKNIKVYLTNLYTKNSYDYKNTEKMENW